MPKLQRGIMDHFLTHLIMRWLQKDAARRIPEESVRAGEYVLTYGWPMKVFGAICAAILTLVVVGPFVFDDAKFPTDNWRGIVFLVFVLGGLLALGWAGANEAFRTSIEVTPDEIVANSAWVGRKVIRWDEIEEVSWSYSNNWFVIRSTTGTKIRVSILIGGVVYLARQLRRLVPESKLVKAAPGFHMVDSVR